MMKVKTFHMIPVVAVLTVMVMGFQNCGGTRFSQVEDGMSLKSGEANVAGDEMNLPPDISLPGGNLPDDMNVPVGDNDGPTDDPTDTAQMTPPPSSQNPGSPVPGGPGSPPTPGGDRNPAAVIDDEDKPKNDVAKKNCEQFKTLEMPLAIPASAKDIKSSNGSGHLEIALGRNVEITNRSGHIYVGAASTLVSSNTSGQYKVAANEIPSLSNASGGSCIIAMKIGTLSNISGNSAIVANEIDLITNHSGDIHVYGATVRKVSNASSKICLHDGAVVLETENHSGRIGKCN